MPKHEKNLLRYKYYISSFNNCKSFNRNCIGWINLASIIFFLKKPPLNLELVIVFLFYPLNYSFSSSVEKSRFFLRTKLVLSINYVYQELIEVLQTLVTCCFFLFSSFSVIFFQSWFLFQFCYSQYLCYLHNLM